MVIVWKNICHTCELGKWENAYLTYEVGEFLDKVVAPDGSFREGLIHLDDIVINPEHIVSVQKSLLYERVGRVELYREC